MSEGEFTIEPGRVPESVKGTLEKMEATEKAMEDQIDGLMELAADENSGLTPVQREGLQNYAKNLRDQLSTFKGDLVERGWFEEGEQKIVH